MDEQLKFQWPGVGELSVGLKGNFSATLRFTPAEQAVLNGLRMAATEPVYGRQHEDHPTHPEAKRTRSERCTEILEHIWAIQ
ncbi:hypothetical protein [uncultured Oscillibacter sp.]|uniref:hypothetical protein n=1 Tax=uncultured Oscillibacter sp. TaxID=876091 RepID=UPI002617F84C|nr:hypothetical protein [uncultured Oscillibacter sp.]